MKKQVLEQYIIRPALQYLDMESDAAVNLLLGTCAQESSMCKYVKQIGGGPAIGIYQIEPDTHQDVIYNYVVYRDELMEKIDKWQIGRGMDEYLISSIFYQTLIARLIYYRAPEALPNAHNVKELAIYWKQYYNTPAGHGTVDQFMHNYQRYVKNA